jgi:hypothetical protein
MQSEHKAFMQRFIEQNAVPKTRTRRKQVETHITASHGLRSHTVDHMPRADTASRYAQRAGHYNNRAATATVWKDYHKLGCFASQSNMPATRHMMYMARCAFCINHYAVADVITEKVVCEVCCGVILPNTISPRCAVCQRVIMCTSCLAKRFQMYVINAPVDSICTEGDTLECS